MTGQRHALRWRWATRPTSPELTAKLIALDDARTAARMIVVADRRVLDDGARIAGVPIDIEVVRPGDRCRAAIRAPYWSMWGTWILRRSSVVASRAGGHYALGNYRHALQLVTVGAADAVCFTPFNKQAMRLAEPSYEDEIGFTAGVLGTSGPATEFNVLDRLWNARVTSHVPLARVASLLTVEGIVDALALTTDALRAAGFEPPRVGVAALNPHAGDGGNFGREEIDIIAPAVERAKAKDFTSKDRIQPTPCSCAPVVANSMRC